MDEVQEIKNRLNIVDIITPYVDLKKTGKSYKGNCPFHSEKTPSFIVTPELGIYKCFGCGESGDIFTFIEKKEGVEFSEALEVLATKAGVTITKKKGRDNKDLYEANKVAQKFFDYCLFKTKEGQTALRYLTEKRKLDSKTIKKFGIGYAPDSWEQTYKTLKTKGLTEKSLEISGLILKGKKGYYDRFRGRITFPFYDLSGRVLGFSARTLKNDESAKYLNTPETPIFHKGSMLYGLFTNKEGIKKSDKALIVEGQMDVIATTAKGFAFSIAPGGTALTNEQLKLVKRFTENVIFSFDSDQAGINALHRSIKLAEQEEINIKVLTLGKYKDPDEMVQNSPKLFEKALNNSPNAYEYLIKNYLKENINSPIKRKKVANEVANVIKNISDPVNKDYYLTQLAQTLGVNKNSIQIKKITNKKTLTNKEESEKPQVSTDTNIVISILKNYPNLEKEFKQEIKELNIQVKNVPEETIMLRAGQQQEIAKMELSKRIKILYKNRLNDLLKQAISNSDKNKSSELLLKIRNYR